MTGFLKVSAVLAAGAGILWAERPVLGSIERLDPALDELIAPEAKMEVLAAGHVWTEGPVWDGKKQRLLYSDIPRNAVYAWNAKDGTTEIFLQPAGFSGPAEYGKEPGSNGLLIDPEGRLLSCEHGDRRVSLLTKGGGKRTLVDAFEGKRLNSPNDLCRHSNGTLFFTDPPYGLPGGAESELRELDFCGVFRLGKDGELSLVDKSLDRPNGVTLSLDEKTLYVAQSHGPAPVIKAWDVDAQGIPSNPRIFFDASELAKKDKGMPDGLKCDVNGNVWCTGPGGLMVISPEGKLLGRLLTGQATSNCAWGEDGSVLFLTADAYVLRLETKTKGKL
ncbi:MAG: SMP-30/gluconolactonase/LRE family protein [Verrucomicrobiales bacterium]